jgi:hypothetical protein
VCHFHFPARIIAIPVNEVTIVSRTQFALPAIVREELILTGANHHYPDQRR